MQQSIGLIPPARYDQYAAEFEQHYELNDYLIIGDSRYAKNKTHQQQGRNCLFCSQAYPQVSFTSEAHLISRMLGNTDLFSTFECDTCNNKFSKLETDLASFLGFGRSLSGMMNPAKAPGFPGIGLEAKSLIYKGKKLLVVHKNGASYNMADGTTKLTYGKPSYTPANVYKLLLKCALSVLPREEIESNFQLALQYLRGQLVVGGAYADMFQFPLGMKLPLHTQIFKKKRTEAELPVYIASIYTDNLVISFPVLPHHEDLRYLDKDICIPVAPPYFVEEHEFDSVDPIYTRYNLSSLDKLKAEPEEMTMHINPEETENMVRFNTKTGEMTQTDYDPSNFKYIIHTEAGVSFSIEEMKELHDLIDQKFKNH